VSARSGIVLYDSRADTGVGPYKEKN